MPKFITIGYGDRDGYDRTDAAVRDAAHAYDARVNEAGVLTGIAGTPARDRDSVEMLTQNRRIRIQL